MFLKKNTILAIFVLFALITVSNPYTAISDSIQNLLNSAKTDTARAYLYARACYTYTGENNDTAIFFARVGIDLSLKHNYNLAYCECLNCMGSSYFYKGQLDSAISCFRKALQLYLKDRDRNGISNEMNNIGEIYRNQSYYNTALIYYKRSLEIMRETENKKMISNSLNNIGLVYFDKGDYANALSNFYESLKNAEDILSKEEAGKCYGNIALIYSVQDNLNKAIEYALKALKLFEESGNKMNQAILLNNIGSNFITMNRYDSAFVYLNKGMVISEEIRDSSNISLIYSNFGVIYQNNGDYEKAMFFFRKGAGIMYRLENKYNVAEIYIRIGELEFIQKKYSNAKSSFMTVLSIADEIGSNEQKRNAYFGLATIDSATSNFSLAFENYKKYIHFQNMIENNANTKKITQLEMQFEFGKKQREQELQQKQKDMQQAEAMKRQKILRNSFITGFILVFLLAFVLLRGYRLKKKANSLLSKQNFEISQQKEEIIVQRDEIAVQKTVIEEINQEVMDSIRYAEKIQRAVLPDVRYISEKIRQEYFILYMPKNIVSGDFFLFEKKKNILLFCVADCTGHGVPGAFMSMLGISFLNEIIAKEEVQSANHVLDELRKYVINSLQQKGSMGEQQDGMDIAFCAINIDTLEMQFAGANNPVYIITQFGNVPINQFENEKRNEQESVEQFPNFQIKSFPNLIELKGDKMPIGIHSNMQPFTNQIYQLQKGDTIYLMSDGFEDQFGGPNRKKFFAKNLKNLLTANSQLPMVNQKQTLETTITEWIGTGEQIDDITVLGIKI